MKTILLALVLIFSVNSVQAAGSGLGWYATFLKGLRSKVHKNVQSRNRATAVAAVRGAKQGGDPRALYWKGGVSDAAAKKLDSERKQLADAVQLVVDGDNAAGRTALEKFIKDNPDSIFLSDAKEALEKLPAAQTAPPAETVKPAGEAVPAAEAAIPAGEAALAAETVKPTADDAPPAAVPETPAAPAESGADTGGASE